MLVEIALIPWKLVNAVQVPVLGLNYLSQYMLGPPVRIIQIALFHSTIILVIENIDQYQLNRACVEVNVVPS